MAEIYAINEEDLDAFVRTATEAPSVMPRAGAALEALQREPDLLVDRPAAFPPRLDSERQTRYAVIGELVYGEMFRRQQRSETLKEGMERVRREMEDELERAWAGVKSAIAARRERAKGFFKRLFGPANIFKAVVTVWALWLVVGTDGMKSIASVAARWIKEAARAAAGIVYAFGPPLLDMVWDVISGAWALVHEKLADPWLDFWTYMSGVDPHTIPPEERNGILGFIRFLLKETLVAFIFNIPELAATFLVVLTAQITRMVVNPLKLIAEALVPDFILDAFDEIEDASRALHERWLAEHSTLVGRVVVLHDEDEETQAVKNLYNLRQEALGLSMSQSGRYDVEVTETGQHYIPKFSTRVRNAASDAWAYLSQAIGGRQAADGPAVVGRAYAAAAGSFRSHAAIAKAKADTSARHGIVLDGDAALATAIDKAAAEAVRRGLSPDEASGFLEAAALQLGAGEALSRDRKAVESMVSELMEGMRRLNRALSARAYRDMLDSGAKTRAFIEGRGRSFYNGSALLVDFMLGGNAAFESVEETARAFTGSLDGDEPRPESIYRLPLTFASHAAAELGAVPERFDRAQFALIPRVEVKAGKETVETGKTQEAVEADGKASSALIPKHTVQTVDLDKINVVDLRRPAAAVAECRAALNAAYDRRQVRATAVTRGWSRRVELLEAVFLDGTLRRVKV